MYNNELFFCPYYVRQNTYPFSSAQWRVDRRSFAPVSGTVTRIEDFNPSPSTTAGCYKLMSIESEERGPVNFVISPETYFVDHEVISAGNDITGFYDANAPALLIYPPQYPAIVIAKETEYENVTVDYFNNDLVSSDGSLQLNLAPTTEIMLTNDQPFDKYPGNRNLIVVYGPTTKSIPAQTTPYKIIVLC